MSALLVVDGREGWLHVQVLARYLSASMPCQILQDSSLPLIDGVDNVCSMLADENPAEYFGLVDARFLIVFTQRQGAGALTRFSLANDWKFESIYVVQEYWGDIIDDDLRPGSLLQYFVRDDFAASLTKRRVGNSLVHVVGCPRYALYESWDLPEVRKGVRDRLGVSPDQQLIGWFGQSPAVEDAYQRTLEKFVEAVAAAVAEGALSSSRKGVSGADPVHRIGLSPAWCGIRNGIG